MTHVPLTTLLLGASGFIGGHIAQVLAEAGHRVVCPLRPARLRSGLPPQLTRPGLEVTALDLTSVGAVASLVSATRPDVVVDAAWCGVQAGERNRPGQQENVRRIATVLDGVRPGLTTTWIGLGSQAEYGTFEGRVDETFAGEPASEYGRAKRAALRLLQERLMPVGSRLVWLRVFGVYGPRQPPGWLIPDVIAALKTGSPLELTGGEQRCDYVYVRDLARACVALAESATARGTFNVGSGQAVPVRTIVQSLHRLVGSRSELRFGEVPYRPGESMYWEADISKLRESTGWVPSTSLADGLEATVRSYAEAA